MSITFINTVEQAILKAQKAREKAIKKERKTAKALSNAQHKHDVAHADEKKAANNLSVCIVILPATQTTLMTPNYVSLRRIAVFFALLR